MSLSRKCPVSFVCLPVLCAIVIYNVSYGQPLTVSERHIEDTYGNELHVSQLPKGQKVIFLPRLRPDPCDRKPTPGEKGIKDVVDGLANIEEVNQRLAPSASTATRVADNGPLLGKVNLIYDADGNFQAFVVAPDAMKSTPVGLVLKSTEGLDVDPILSVLTRKNVLARFDFHDPIQDVTGRGRQETMKDQPLSYLKLDRSIDTRKAAQMIDAIPRDFAKKDRLAGLAFIANESVEGMLDFISYSGQVRGKVTGDRIYLFLGRAYNAHDFGNLMWGAAVAKLGIPEITASLGAELNGFLNTKAQNGENPGIILYGDSDRDQDAIRQGFAFWRDFGDIPINKKN